MENLRWILIFAGVAILVLLYFSGRGQKVGRGQSTRAGRSNARGNDMSNNEYSQLPNENADPLMGEQGYDQGFDQFADPSFSDPRVPSAQDLDGFDDPDDFARPGAHYPEKRGQATESKPTGVTGGLGSLSRKIEAFSDRLTPGRRQRVAESEPIETTEENAAAYASKIITLHVVSSPGSLLPAAELLQVFETRGYHFGEMNIFHSMHNGKTVFSIAKMVEPGFFDINSVESFETPGITLILQLPGPVPADVAFEVLVSEAFEMANELNATVLDGDRSTLTKQTVQHLREGIYEYMHRQKYFGTVPS